MSDPTRLNARMLRDLAWRTSPGRYLGPCRWSPGYLPAGAWARICAVGDTGAALAAVLKAAGGPEPTLDVRWAASLALDPNAALPYMTRGGAAAWRSLVGPEADVLRPLPHVDTEWGDAVRWLRAMGYLVEDLAAGTWAPGPGIHNIYTEGWPDGRAAVAWTLVRSGAGRDDV